jgi:hypothetical protein
VRTQGVRTKEQIFKVEIPLDNVLNKMKERLTLNKVFNPAALYVQKRRVVVDWMCEMGEDLSFNTETIHHSIAIFDAFFGHIDVMQTLQAMKLSNGRTFT